MKPPKHFEPGQAISVEVAASLAGERLDRCVALLTGLSRSEASRLVGAGRVSVGGAAVTSGSRRLREGEHLQLLPPEGLLVAGEGEGGRAATPSAREPSPEPTIVFADRELLVVDKPAGLVVHPGAGNRQGTLVQKLLALFPDIAAAGPDPVRPGVVHRLDKGTSGLMVVARTAAARRALAHQLATRTMARKYLAVVHGEVAEDAGSVDAPLGRSPRNRQKVAVVSSGRPSVTHYQVLARSRLCFPASLLLLRLETGRTHQVRAHLAAIGHPVAGDDVYCGRADLEDAARSLPLLARPWLHAVALQFRHPATGADLQFVSEPPAELARALEELGLGLGELRLGLGELRLGLGR